MLDSDWKRVKPRVILNEFNEYWFLNKREGCSVLLCSRVPGCNNIASCYCRIRYIDLWTCDDKQHLIWFVWCWSADIAAAIIQPSRAVLPTLPPSNENDLNHTVTFTANIWYIFHKRMRNSLLLLKILFIVYSTLPKFSLIQFNYEVMRQDCMTVWQIPRKTYSFISSDRIPLM